MGRTPVSSALCPRERPLLVVRRVPPTSDSPARTQCLASQRLFLLTRILTFSDARGGLRNRSCFAGRQGRIVQAQTSFADGQGDDFTRAVVRIEDVSALAGERDVRRA